MCGLSCCRNFSFLIFLLSFVTFCIAFGVPYWYKGPAQYEGLWQTCKMSDGDKLCEINSGTGMTDPLIMGVQACMCIALASYIIALGCYGVWLKQSDSRGLSNLARVALIFSAFGGVSNCVAVLVYGTDFVGVQGVSFDWGFLLAIISGALMTLNGFITLCAVSCDRLRNPKYTAN